MKHLSSILILLVIGLLTTIIVAADSSPPEAETLNKELTIETHQSQVGVIFHDTILDDEVLTKFVESEVQITPIFAVAQEVSPIDYSVIDTKQVVKYSSRVVYDKTFNPTLSWEVLYRNTNTSPVTYDLVIQDKIPRSTVMESL